MKTMTSLLSTTLVLMVATSSTISKVDAISSGSLGMFILKLYIDIMEGTHFTNSCVIHNGKFENNVK